MLGIITGAAGARITGGEVRFDFATIVGTGLLGAFTTFSSEEWQGLVTYHKRPLWATRNVGATLVLSMVVAGIGPWIGSQF